MSLHWQAPSREIATRAIGAVGTAIKAGRAVRSEACEMCGITEAELANVYARSKLHGHHEDYARPLSVIWLCTTCHRSFHKKKFREANESKINRLWRQK
jgi:hypothetical protein